MAICMLSSPLASEVDNWDEKTGSNFTECSDGQEKTDHRRSEPDKNEVIPTQAAARS
jgi:hypothetical protein